MDSGNFLVIKSYLQAVSSTPMTPMAAPDIPVASGRLPGDPQITPSVNEEFIVIKVLGRLRLEKESINSSCRSHG